MSTVKISPAQPDEAALAAEIAQLRELDVSTLRARWRVVFRKDAPSHLPRHLLMRILAYRLQADRLGDLDAESQRLLDSSTSPQQVSARVSELRRRRITLRPGTVLSREWKGQSKRSPSWPTAFPGTGQPIQVCPGLLASSRAPAGMVRSSLGCATNRRKDAHNDVRHSRTRSLRHLHSRIG